jgi:hypothetical protein
MPVRVLPPLYNSQTTTPLENGRLLTSYIANLSRYKDHHRACCEDMTSRSFPGIISNDILPGELREYPFCKLADARTAMENRIAMLRDPGLAFFFLFIEDSQHNDIAAFELGLAIQSSATIVLVGPHPRSSIHTARDKNKIVSAYDWENFIAQRFP